jgi:hypothetical protein
MVEFGSGLNELSMVKSATSADPVESTFRFAAEIDLPKIKQNKQGVLPRRAGPRLCRVESR